MRADLLLALADWIERPRGKGVPRFTMSTWWNGPRPEPSCDTAACALGDGTLCPALRTEGLCLEPIAGDPGDPGNFIPSFKGSRGISAGAALFEITHRASELLFDPCHYAVYLVSPAAVAARLRYCAAVGPGQLADDYDTGEIA